MKKYVCIDIGGTAIKYGLINEVEEILTKSSVPTPSSGGPGIMEEILNITESFLKEGEIGDNIISGVCISTAGMVDSETGSIFHAADTIPGYKGLEIRRQVMERFELPCEVENDVNCVGLAEAIRGSGADSDSVLCLTIGTGIGGCAVLNKKVLHGHTGSACEVGYLQIPGGVFEKLGAASILTKRVAEKKNEPAEDWDGIHIFAAAKAGDQDCIESIDEMCEVLGLGISNICYILNPETIVLGGGIMAQWEYLYPKLRAALDRHLVEVIAKNTKLVHARFGNDAGMVGAYLHFCEMQKKRVLEIKRDGNLSGDCRKN